MTPSKLARVGMELYTVRSKVAADMAGTLAALAKIGYKEVEFAGYYNHAATEIRDMLKANGLTAPSAHVGIEAIETSGTQTFARRQGDRPRVHHGRVVAARREDDGRRLEAGGGAIQQGGRGVQGRRIPLRVSQPQRHRAKKTGDVLPIDILMKETDPALVSYEMDIYWAVNGGADPLQLLAAYPGRFSMFHAKDSMGPPDHKMADVGAGVIDFKTIFAHGKGVEHTFVEHDNPPDPMASAEASYKYLSNLEF